MKKDFVGAFVFDGVPFMALSTVTSQTNKMAVMQTPEKFHFLAKLLLSLRCALVHALNGSHEAIVKPCLVHGSKSTSPYDCTEIVRSTLDFYELEVSKKRCAI